MGCMSSRNSNVTARHHVTVKAGVKQLRQIYNINPKVLGAGTFGKVF